MISRNKREGGYLGKLEDRHIRGVDSGFALAKRVLFLAPCAGTALVEMHRRTHGAYGVRAWLNGIKVPR